MLSLPKRLHNIAQGLRPEIFRRAMASAQKAALVWWQKRTVPPGVAARFTAAGAKFYQFGRRGTKQAQVLPYFHLTGGLQRQVLSRRPHTQYAGETVESRLSIDGGVLNLLSRVYPIRGVLKRVRTVNENYTVRPYTRRNPKSGAMVHVSGYTASRRRMLRETEWRRAPPSMRDEFKVRPIDLRAIEARTKYEWERAVKRIALTNDGRIREHMRRASA